MSTDANIFVGTCHVCLSNRACHVFNHVPDGQFPQTLQPSEEVVADPVGPLLVGAGRQGIPLGRGFPDGRKQR